jgi:isocitrate dehydrogenase (NAD+)
MFLSACMMLDHIGQKTIADKIRTSIAKVIEAGKVRTYDMMKLKGGPNAIKNGAASSQQMTDEVISNL